jgi:hypothetical protein
MFHSPALADPFQDRNAHFRAVRIIPIIARSRTLLPRFAVQEEVAAGTLSTVSVKEFVGNPLVFCVCALKGLFVDEDAQMVGGIEMALGINQIVICHA